MTASTRSFDLIVFGSTGFTGKIAAEYFAKHMDPQRRWAIAGRSSQKLADLFVHLKSFTAPPCETLVVDHDDAQAITALVGRTRVAINYAGPFSRYGENIVAACARLGTHYLDITGETNWVRNMMDRYASQAQASGAILIPFSGFDSVPSDLGSWRVTELAQHAHPTQDVTRVVNLISIRGGINGGTFETLLDILAFNDEETTKYNDPALLVPGHVRHQFAFPGISRPVRVREENLVAPPFFMEPINSRVVYRAQALRLDRTGGSSKPFEYVELMRLPRWASALTSWGTIISGALLQRVGRKSFGRALLKRFGIKSGRGPSEEVREHGFFRTQFFAYSGQRLLARFEMSYPGDPGNKATALLSAESALCLVDDLQRLPTQAGGFWTPSTALGSVLAERLMRAGVTFSPPWKEAPAEVLKANVSVA